MTTGDNLEIMGNDRKLLQSALAFQKLKITTINQTT